MYVYVLRSEKDQTQYVGMSKEPERRLEKEHNVGKVKSTKSKMPWKIIYIEYYETREEARQREKYLKSAAGRRFRKNLGV
ncbi:putative endonuclease [Roseivirga pacifica]|uniref:Putative endonuclease n=1 Tax=Roseivirga pacifica TaxID=1267423 RepID=A0A1I0MH60_9BACT|nr:GIY-YIG nuclease family protein [Roseivirga pacifica]RKQ50401.1 putative endonuclease [Roseivirga pacifica]SEV87705.1 putative endonuclease [Roseivirga pacifica]